MYGRILVVDDEPVVLDVLCEVLSREGYPVSRASEAQAALDLLAREPQELVLCDIRMPGMDGFELLREITRSHPGTDVIMMTGYGSLDGAVDAMSMGAADYLIKPLKPKEILARIRAILERRRLEAELSSLQGELRTRFDMHNIVASSPRMSAVVAALRRIAGQEDNAVLVGERGSGRNFVARAIHYASPRRDRPFACVTCEAGTGDGLAESLFGRRVSARGVQRGQLEHLRGGTLHLREIEACSPAVQQRLGAALRSKQFTRLEDGEVLPLEVRLIVSACSELTELFDQERLVPELDVLREWVSIQVPPLAQRSADIPGLVAHFVQTYALDHGAALSIPSEAIELLQQASFPGNVGQLNAVLHHCAALSPGGRVTSDLVALSLRQAGLRQTQSWAPMSDHLGDRERLLVMRAVSRHPGRLDQAARELGISRTTLWRRMRKYGIRLTAS